jgi:hypothetical protein
MGSDYAVGRHRSLKSTDVLFAGSVFIRAPVREFDSVADIDRALVFS